MKNIFLIIIVLIFNVLTTQAQQKQKTSDSQLAFQYYMDKDFDKASELYKNLYDKTNSKIYFDYFIKCLIALNEYDEAEKHIKTQMRRFPNNFAYMVSLGNLYKRTGKTDKAERQFEKAIDEMRYSYSDITRLANAFITAEEYDYAEKTYLKARNKFYPERNFRFELANVYIYQRNYQKMIDEYLYLLAEKPKQLPSVKNRLQLYLNNDHTNEIGDMLKTSLLKRIQSVDTDPIYNELLIWFFMQKKEFNQAFIQAKALDRRYNESGEGVFRLARLAQTNKEYDVALKAYKYVADKGNSIALYREAKLGILDVHYQKVVSGITIDENEIANLENEYLEVVEEFGKSRAVIALKNLAHLQAFYLHKKDEAIEILEELIQMPRINKDYKAQCILELADIKLLTGDVWEATLLYKQVEQENAQSPIGHEAKFRKAQIAYYTGDFKWAQSQLDVLKASTSKLIANDAFELSQLIQDNTGVDSTETALQTYANAELMLKQHQDSLALITLDSVLTHYKGHTLVDEVYFRKAQVFEKRGDYENAVELYEKVATDYKYDILADNALYKLGLLYEYHLNDKESAMNAYQTLLLEYQGSIYTVEARKRYRMLRGDNSEYIK